jgi:hypothetical protein
MRGERRAVTYDGVRYEPGGKFRVATEDATLDGMKCAGPYAWDGWRQRLRPGDVLTCTGYGAGWGSDPGYGVEFTTPESEAAGAFHCDVHPGVVVPFGYRPRPGVLEPVSPDAAVSS